MGTTYSNCQVRHDSQDAVAEALKPLLKEPAYVAPAVGGWVGVYPEGGTTDPEELAKQLSASLSCGVFSWNVYDSDVFIYTLYEHGNPRDTFNSDPDWGTDPDDEYALPPDAAERERVSGQPEVLVQYCLPGTSYSQIQEVLHPPLSTAPDEELPPSPNISEKHLLMFSEALKTTPDAMRQEFKQLARRKYQFAEEQASDLAKLFGIAEDLEAHRYRDVAETDGSFAGRQFRLVGNENLSQVYLNQKLWDTELIRHPEKLQEWLQKGADPNARKHSGETILMHRAQYGHLESMQILIEAGADVNASTISRHEHGLESGVTPLMLAVMNIRAPAERRIAAVQTLLSSGADVNAESETGRTALRACFGFMNPADQSFSRPLTPEQMEQAEQIADVLRAAGATE